MIIIMLSSLSCFVVLHLDGWYTPTTLKDSRVELSTPGYPLLNDLIVYIVQIFMQYVKGTTFFGRYPL